MTDQSQIYVRVSDVPAKFGISRATVYRAEKRGEIKIHRGTGRSLLKISDVVAWVEGSGAN